MANVHIIGDKARAYVLEHGGSITKRDENAYDVTMPSKGLIALGGYGYHRGSCTLYAYSDGFVLDFTVETGNHTLYRRVLTKGMLEHFGSVDDPKQLEALAE